MNQCQVLAVFSPALSGVFPVYAPVHVIGGKVAVGDAEVHQLRRLHALKVVRHTFIILRTV